MSRETAREIAIREPVDTVPYQDQRELTRRLGANLSEAFMAKVTGAGGAGGSITEVPFEPAYIEAWGLTSLSLFKSFFSDDGSPVHMSMIDTGAGATDLAANANPPVLTRVGDGDWTVALPTQMAPDGEEVVVMIYGFRSGEGGNGSL